MRRIEEMGLLEIDAVEAGKAGGAARRALGTGVRSEDGGAVADNRAPNAAGMLADVADGGVEAVRICAADALVGCPASGIVA